jgi:hypothetical protein
VGQLSTHNDPTRGVKHIYSVDCSF